MKEKIINVLIFILFCVYYYISIATSYSLIVTNKGGWYLGEWIINYQDGGFKRRGLCGSLFILINEFTKINIENIVFSFLVFIYTSFFILLIRLFVRERNNLLVLCVLLLPAGLGMMIKDPSIASKKEIIFFLFYLIYITCLQSKIIIKDYILSLFIIIGILIHEAAYFYLPFVSFTYWVKTKSLPFDKFKRIVLYQLVPSTILMFILFKFGINISTENSEAFLKNHGLVFTELGIYEYDTKYNVVDFYKANIYSYQTYAISLIIASFTFYIYFKFNKIKLNSYFLCVQVLFLLPLFYLALDWGRWINIFFTLLTIFVATEQKMILTRKQEIIAIAILLFNLFWRMMLKTEGFLTFPALDSNIKKIYYALYFKIKSMFN